MIGSTSDLERRVFQLETLYEIGGDCARAGTIDDVLQVVLSAVMGAFGALSGVALAGRADGTVEAVRARGLAELDLTELALAYLRDEDVGPLAAAAWCFSCPSVGPARREGWSRSVRGCLGRATWTKIVPS